jgi:hypothetical protein
LSGFRLQEHRPQNLNRISDLLAVAQKIRHY